MKHTDFYSLHKALDNQAYQELRAAVRAHGNEYVFIHIDEDGDYDTEEENAAPIVSASTKWMDGFEDFYITRVAIDDNDYVTIYGYNKEGYADEYEIDAVSHGHLEYIIDHIPETEEVKDVTILKSES